MKEEEKIIEFKKSKNNIETKFIFIANIKDIKINELKEYFLKYNKNIKFIELINITEKKIVIEFENIEDSKKMYELLNDKYIDEFKRKLVINFSIIKKDKIIEEPGVKIEDLDDTKVNINYKIIKFKEYKRSTWFNNY
jgi:hypothetical protein